MVKGWQRRKKHLLGHALYRKETGFTPTYPPVKSDPIRKASSGYHIHWPWTYLSADLHCLSITEKPLYPLYLMNLYKPTKCRKNIITWFCCCKTWISFLSCKISSLMILSHVEGSRHNWVVVFSGVSVLGWMLKRSEKSTRALRHSSMHFKISYLQNFSENSTNNFYLFFIYLFQVYPKQY